LFHVKHICLTYKNRANHVPEMIYLIKGKCLITVT